MPRSHSNPSFSMPEWLLAAIVLLHCAMRISALHAGEPQPFNLLLVGQVRLVDLHQTNQQKHVDLESPLTLKAGQALQLDWDHPRDIRKVRLGFAGIAPAPEETRIEWWRRIWPDNGKGGWMKLDDPFNGQWTAATLVPAACGANSVDLAMAQLDSVEAPGIKNKGHDYRHTYKLRISFRSPATLKSVGVFSDAVTRQARLRFQWDLNTKVPGHWAPRFEARNGRILKIKREQDNAALVDLAYADATNRLSADRGFVICRSGELRSFSVFVDDVLREGGVFVRDIGAFVSDPVKFPNYLSWHGPAAEAWPEGTVVEQVSRLPEQSFDNVSRVVPAKPANDVFLGAPNLRQEIAVGPGSEIRLYADSLRSPGPDLDRRPWKWKVLEYRFKMSQAEPAAQPDAAQSLHRGLEEAWLPVVNHHWRSGDLDWQQSAVAAPLLVDIAQLQSRTGTEPLMLVMRFAVTNTAATQRKAQLSLKFNQPLPLRLQQGAMVLAAPSEGPPRDGLTPVRGVWFTGNKGRLGVRSATQPANSEQSDSQPDAGEEVVYTVELPGGQTHLFHLAIAYTELLNPEELRALRTARFDAVHNSVVAFWQARVDRGMTWQCPEQWLNHFWKANLWHVLISTDLDPVTGHSQHGAATRVYPNFLNETAMVARSLEMRGESEEAARLLEPFLACQGVKGLPGNFQSKDGVFYAAHSSEPDPYTAQGYNMHHGWGLWAIAEHYQWTADDAYLHRVADQLVKGCRWIARERNATRHSNLRPTRPLEYGLAPAGDLEDVQEYLYFYATDAYYFLGMKKAAEALAAIRHPQAAQLSREATRFLKDIRTSVAESVATSPVVRLRDGSYVPFVPPRTHALTHLKEGWIREALYSASHLYDGEIYPSTHPFIEWVAQNLEDNVYLSRESGYGLEHPREAFFHFGGITLQPNLVNLPLLYLERDQISNFLRGFYNTAWASLYPDTMCFAEWVPAFGKGGGPLFKTPDECKFIQWMRSMLLWESDSGLALGLGVPRAWMLDGQKIHLERAATLFGRVNLHIDSRAASRQIDALVALEPMRRPREIRLRLRDPLGRPIASARVNDKPALVDSARQLIELPAGNTRWQVHASF